MSSFGKFTHTFWYQLEFSLLSCARILASVFPTGDQEQQWACWYQHCWIHISSGRSSGNQIQWISSHGHPERLKGKHVCVVTVETDYERRKGRDKWGFNRKAKSSTLTSSVPISWTTYYLKNKCLENARPNYWFHSVLYHYGNNTISLY